MKKRILIGSLLLSFVWVLGHSKGKPAALVVAISTKAPVDILSLANSRESAATASTSPGSFHSLKKEMKETQWNDPVWSEYRKLSSATVPSQKDKERLEVLKAKGLVYDSAIRFLKAEDEKEINIPNQFARIQAVDYFAEVISDTNNPLRPRVLAEAENLLTNEEFLSKESVTLRKSIAGDRIELYRIMRSTNPAKANEVVKKMNGTRLGKLYASPDKFSKKSKEKKERS